MSSDNSLFNVEVKPFKKTIEVPSSKSYANRLLILAAISHEDILVENLPLSSDVSIMIECLGKIGLVVKKCAEGVWIKGSFPECETSGPHILATGDGGTTNRFLCSLLARGKEEYILKPEGHMHDRPMLPLLEALEVLGVQTSYKTDKEWIKVQGPIKEVASVTVDAKETTQFLTSVSLALADKKISVDATHLLVSLPYWNLTKKLIKDFQNKNLSYFNPVDFSSLTYPIALAAVTGEVLVSNCKEIDENQADSAFINLLKTIGAKVNWKEEGLQVEYNQLNPIDFDGSQCPDAVPTILFVCSFCQGKSRIYNLEVLTHKECDRFREMVRMLRSFGVEVEIDTENFEILVKGPTEEKRKFNYDPPADHRMVMVAYLFQRALAGGKLSNHTHIKKSFSNFFEVME